MEQNQQQQQVQSIGSQNRLLFWAELYSDIVIRSVISFVIALVLISVMSIWLKIPTLIVFLGAFTISILLSPFLSRIKLSKYIFLKYMAFLQRQFNKFDKKEK